MNDISKEQLDKGGQVAAASVEAAQSETDPEKRHDAAKQAAQREARKVEIELSEEDAGKLADAIITQLDLRGAFQPPPEPVQAPPQEGAPPEAAPAPPPEAQQPRKQTFAERFRS